MKRIVILGGGFGGVYAAKHLQKLFKRNKERYEISLVSRENYFTYQPMLAEVVAGSLSVLEPVSSLRSLLKHTKIYVREISDIDLGKQTVTLSPNFHHTDLILPYDHLVIALGNVTDFRNSSGGLKEHALAFKTLRDAIRLRNHLIDVLEAAIVEPDPEIQKELLTFVVGGGGFSGVEVVAEINDLVRTFAKKHKLKAPIRIILAHRRDHLIDKELSHSLCDYTEALLKQRGVEILFHTSLTSATPQEAILENGDRIPSRTIVSTVPSTANPLIEELPVEKVGDRIKTDIYLRISGAPNLWALGDCAAVPMAITDQISPPTAQFAVRQGKALAHNLFATANKKTLKPFTFQGLGTMAALGHKRAVAEIFGKIKLSGFIAWILWRLVYWMKLPGVARKVRVGASWFFDLFLPQELVQIKAEVHDGINHLHYVKGDTIFYKGDVGDLLYVIATGSVGVLDDQQKVIATLRKGEYFGEMALIRKEKRIATVICLEDVELIAIRKNDFNVLITNFGNLRDEILKVDQDRRKKRIALDNTGDFFNIDDGAQHG